MAKTEMQLINESLGLANGDYRIFFIQAVYTKADGSELVGDWNERPDAVNCYEETPDDYKAKVRSGMRMAEGSFDDIKVVGFIYNLDGKSPFSDALEEAYVIEWIGYYNNCDKPRKCVFRWYFVPKCSKHYESPQFEAVTQRIADKVKHKG
jgi:hypothetical protein